ncbi:hypothetical protein Plhal710r2_c011g0049621 [Plasmopara halstedii]
MTEREDIRLRYCTPFSTNLEWLCRLGCGYRTYYNWKGEKVYTSAPTIYVIESTQTKYPIWLSNAEALTAVDTSALVHIPGKVGYDYNVSGVQIEQVSARMPTFAQFRTRYCAFTNAQYQNILKNCGLISKCLRCFLAHWENWLGVNPASWIIPTNLEQTSVLKDATAYAKFYGKRLSNHEKWQFVVSSGINYDFYTWDLNLTQSSYRICTTASSCPSSLPRDPTNYSPVLLTLADPNWYLQQPLDSQHHNRLVIISEEYDRSPL